MLYRIILFCLLGGFILPVAAESLPQGATLAAIDKKLGDLERSVAILQLSSVSPRDHQALVEQVKQLKHSLKERASTEDRVDFLSNVVFLLCVVVLLCILYGRRQSRQLAKAIAAKQIIK